jgi:stage V sporulation protein AC
MQQPLTKKEYAELVKKTSPNSKAMSACMGAFLVGGLICALGQGLANLYIRSGMTADTAYAVMSVTLIFLSALLTGFDLYPSIAKAGGAGSLVPITGFANAITSPAMEFKAEGYVLGLGAKMFSIAGPVIVYGYSAGILYGLLLFLFGLY